MILTCPECATSYFVDDSRVPAAGRLVKCTSCGARWTAVKDPSPPAAPPPAKPAQTREPEPFVPAAADDLEIVAMEPALAAARTAPRKEAAGKVTILAIAAGLVVALIVGAILFRGAVVRILPASQAAYAGIGLPVNTLGLVLENIHAQPVFQGGRPVLAVTGAIRNIGDDTATAPPIRISLLDRAGKPVSAKVATPLDARVPGRAVRHFAISIADPPASVHDLEVTFEGDAKGVAPAAAALSAPAPAPPTPSPGATPVEAQPLPPGSQDALPQHD